MEYCVQHNGKAYTEEEFDGVEIHECSGAYQDVTDRRVRVYCFAKVDEVDCPLEKKGE